MLSRTFALKRLPLLQAKHIRNDPYFALKAFGRVGLDRSRINSRVQRRAFGSARPGASESNASESPIRVSYIIGALLVFGVSATAWGLYEFYMTLTMWPKEVRGDLRAGLRAKQRGDLKLSQRHLARAWEVVNTLPPSSLSPDPYLKISGVAIVLAEVLEADHQLEQAFTILREALSFFIRDQRHPSIPVSAPAPPSSSSTPPAAPAKPAPRLTLLSLLDSERTATPSADADECDTRTRMRAVALALKLGALAEALSRPAEEEVWLSFAVAEVLRVVRAEYGLAHDVRRGFVGVGTSSRVESTSTPEQGRTDAETNSEQTQQEVHEHGIRDILGPNAIDGELGLPPWVSLTKTELAAPMERLGAFYARQGRAGNAITLYRVASALLVQPKPKSLSAAQAKRRSPPSVQELCQALQIENAHMALLMDLRRTHPNDAVVARDLPRVLHRAVNLYDEAVRGHTRARGGGGRSATDDDIDADGGDAEIALCDETYPAVLFNAGVCYEEEGSYQEALRSYSLAYQAMRGHVSREQAQETLESARRVQRILDKEKGSKAGDTTSV
ncbi:hypothetical protein M0805_002113 [Coniferiporia weirii]|nr:hypothetical protein M0805_002113 [Coniferiporia weirii]